MQNQYDQSNSFSNQSYSTAGTTVGKTQQVSQIHHLIQQLITQTQQASYQYQQLLAQEQQNARLLEQIAQKEHHAAQVIQTALQGHQTAIQQLQQINSLAQQLSVVSPVSSYTATSPNYASPLQSSSHLSSNDYGGGFQSNVLRNESIINNSFPSNVGKFNSTLPSSNSLHISNNSMN